jgi:hypothetical protein
MYQDFHKLVTNLDFKNDLTRNYKVVMKTMLPNGS